MKAILDASGEPTGDSRPLTVLDVLSDAVFMVDSSRLMQSKEQAEQLLPEKMKENYTLWKTLYSGVDLKKEQKEALKGYLLGMQGSDVVKYQVLNVLEVL